MNEVILNELLRLLINDIHSDKTKIREKRMDKLNLAFNYTYENGKLKHNGDSQ